MKKIQQPCTKILKTVKSSSQQQEIQPQFNENLKKQAALSNKVYNHLSFDENMSNEEDTTADMKQNFKKC